MPPLAAPWLSAVEGLAAVHERLKRVVILNAPALDVIRQEDGKKTLYYLDPPYPHETRTSTDAYGEFEMTNEDHAELLDTINQCKCKVMISGYDCALYQQRLAHWNRHHWELPNNAAGGAKKGREIETLWCNF